ncbi:L,D-transpeptidase family protein [Paenibacillus sp. YIM B09110]|uniref:L,D-transpeptidase family protein n=1 Tax=Paenibacillus sp. YIM B09110 TaxID=3126102 RepID=UPI00301DB31B
MESPEDIFYLKQFVKQHPDNQMGWYLLGKQYLLAGKEGKANYCFIQAGEIYDAFERESHPLAEHQLQFLREWSQKQKKKRFARRFALVAIVLIGVVLSLPAGRELNHEEAVSPIIGSQQTVSKVGVILIPQKELRPVGYAWEGLMNAGQSAPLKTIAAKLEEDKGWRNWTGRATILLAVEAKQSDEEDDTSAEESRGVRTSDGNELGVTMFDSNTCNCIPAESSGIYKEYRDWQTKQELHWTVGSAVAQYKKLYGNWPSKLEDLVRPYPNNVLAGEKEGMREAFREVLERLKAKEQAGQSGEKGTEASGGSTGNGNEIRTTSAVGSNGYLEPNWSKPLEIVVDKSTHRLAVVQGNIIVRSYKVGLGADRTPEGSFYVSEKVKNPNGSDNGTFGSRGMTLSNTLYAIHGTDEPDSIGKDESLGCIRMGKADVEELYDLVPLGTPVKVKNGTLPSDSKPAAVRFKLEPKQDETNPVKVYEWLN